MLGENCGRVSGMHSSFQRYLHFKRKTQNTKQLVEVLLEVEQFWGGVR